MASYFVLISSICPTNSELVICVILISVATVSSSSSLSVYKVLNSAQVAYAAECLSLTSLLYASVNITLI